MSHDTAIPNSVRDKPVQRTDQAVLAALRERSEFKDLTRSQVQRMLSDGWIFVQGMPVTGKSKLDSVAGLEVRPPVREPLAVAPISEPIPILFEDEDLVVIDKPIGLVVHADAHHTDHVSGRLLRQLGSLSRLFEDRPGIVHRLDKETSGALVVAKTDRAHVGLSELFAKHELRREYRAWVYGVPREKSWKVDNRIMRDPNDRKRFIIAKKDRDEGRRAISHFSVAEVFDFGMSELRVRLETGRTHQVRVHANSSGHSVAGDRVYGAPTSRQHKWVSLPSSVQKAIEALSGQALHAEILEFKHPVTQNVVSVQAPLPGHLVQFVAGLKSSLALKS